jgi:hypothetical protein
MSHRAEDRAALQGERRSSRRMPFFEPNGA